MYIHVHVYVCYMYILSACLYTDYIHNISYTCTYVYILVILLKLQPTLNTQSKSTNTTYNTKNTHRRENK